MGISTLHTLYSSSYHTISTSLCFAICCATNFPRGPASSRSNGCLIIVEPFYHCPSSIARLVELLSDEQMTTFNNDLSKRGRTREMRFRGVQIYLAKTQMLRPYSVVGCRSACTTSPHQKGAAIRGVWNLRGRRGIKSC